MAAYLVWASQQRQRQRRCVVAAQGAGRWLDGYALAVLAAPPREFTITCGSLGCNGTREQDFEKGLDKDPPMTRFWGWGVLLHDLMCVVNFDMVHVIPEPMPTSLA